MGQWLGIEVERAKLLAAGRKSACARYLEHPFSTHLLMPTLRIEQNGPSTTTKGRRFDDLGLLVDL